MDLYKFHAKSSILKGYEESDNIVPSRILDILRYKGPDKLTQKQIEKLAQNPEYALDYAQRTKKPFPEGEKVIAADARSAYYYANDVLKKRWPVAEKVISKHPAYAYYYAVDVIKGRWPMGEKAILEDPETLYLYVKRIIKGPWPEGEDALAKDPDYSIPYAVTYLKKRFLKAEPAIAKNKYKKYYEDHFKVKL